MAQTELKRCEVCWLLDGDASEKDCFYCPSCHAFICRADLNNWVRRGQAMLKRKLQPAGKHVPRGEPWQRQLRTHTMPGQKPWLAFRRHPQRTEEKPTDKSGC